MANPNIVNVTSILGRVENINLTGTSATLVVSNAASSNKIFKINSLIVSNVSTTSTEITVSYYTGASLGGTAFELVKGIAVPAAASLIVIDKGSSIYLEESRSLGAIAGAANNLKITCSYEEIS